MMERIPYGRTSVGIGGKRKCCGTCRNHIKGKEDPDWSCDNPESERYGEYTGYEERCDDYEPREPRRP